jgi:hypothetical protein
MVHTHYAEDHVLNIPEPSAGHGQAPHALPRGLVSIEQLLATQNELMKM